MRTRHFIVALFALAALGASSARGSVESADKPRMSPAVLPTIQQHGQLGMLDARHSNQFPETTLLAFADKETEKEKDKDKKPPPPPPKRSEKCGQEGQHNGQNEDHDCKGDK
jgi:hypothetical protein